MRGKHILILTALGACSASGTQTVDYYREHDAERSARINKCLAAFDSGQDCRNATQAEFEKLGIAAKNGEALQR